jgi:hypothetical protein
MGSFAVNLLLERDVKGGKVRYLIVDRGNRWTSLIFDSREETLLHVEFWTKGQTNQAAYEVVVRNPRHAIEEAFLIRDAWAGSDHAFKALTDLLREMKGRRLGAA